MSLILKTYNLIKEKINSMTFMLGSTVQAIEETKRIAMDDCK